MKITDEALELYAADAKDALRRPTTETKVGEAQVLACHLLTIVREYRELLADAHTLADRNEALELAAGEGF